MIIKRKLHFLVALGLLFSFALPSIAGAVPLTQAGLRLGRLGNGASSANDLLVTFKPNTVAGLTKVKITFPTGFTLTAGTPTPLTTPFPATPAGITVTPGTLTSVVTSSGAGLGGTIVVSGISSPTTGVLYGFIIPTGSITNPSTLGQYNTTTESEDSGGTPIETTTTPIYITGATADKDKITVSASVAPNFSFNLSANADTVPAADPTAIFTSPGVTMTVGTNSPLGYTAYVKSLNASLNSAGSGGTIATGTFDGTPEVFTAGTTKYGFVPTTGTLCSSCNGAIVYDTEFGNTDATHGGAFNTATNFASFVSRTGYTNADQISLKERVTVANTVPYANDYADTLTIVAAGNF